MWTRGCPHFQVKHVKAREVLGWVRLDGWDSGGMVSCGGMWWWSFAKRKADIVGVSFFHGNLRGTPSKKQPALIAGLLKGNQWLIVPDHKAGYFLAFGGSGPLRFP